MIKQYKPTNRKIILSLILLLAATLLSIFVIVILSITSVNEEARVSIERYVTATIEDKLKQHETLTKDYAYWDETIQNAYHSPNPDWINDNIGEYLTDTFKITDLFIIDSHNQAVLSLKDGHVDKSNFLTVDKDALTSLIGEARKSSGTAPIPVSGIIMINNTPALVGASILAPEDSTPLPSPRPLLLLAVRLDSSYLHVLSKQYRLKDLHFTPENLSNTTLSTVEIKNPLKKTLGELAWQAEKPGDLVLSKIQLPLLILLVAITLITAFIIKASHITVRKLEKAYDDLIYNANHDALTGMANRHLFDELLKQTIHSAKREKISCAILYIDLDDFKKVNDTFGHKTGDQLLVTTAERIKSSIRESDSTARIGGDEFIVLLQNISGREDIAITAQKILTSLTQPTEISDKEIQVSASMGIAIIPNDGIDPDALMKKADVALYDCKNDGKNVFQFYTDA